jgi:hypothetical protein
VVSPFADRRPSGRSRRIDCAVDDVSEEKRASMRWRAPTSQFGAYRYPMTTPFPNGKRRLAVLTSLVALTLFWPLAPAGCDLPRQQRRDRLFQ